MSSAIEAATARSDGAARDTRYSDAINLGMADAMAEDPQSC
jgi:hypothetical protein